MRVDVCLLDLGFVANYPEYSISKPHGEDEEENGATTARSIEPGQIPRIIRPSFDTVLENNVTSDS